MTLVSIPHRPHASACDETTNERLQEMRCGPPLRDFLVANYVRLHRRLTRHLGCADTASECLHDAWLRLGAMQAPPAVQSPEAYVYRVACNIAVDRMRSDRSWQYTRDADAELQSFADQAPGPELIAEARSDLQAVEHAMQQLPVGHRAILIALRVDEMTREQVAIRSGLSLRRVDAALHQALACCAAPRFHRMSI